MVVMRVLHLKVHGEDLEDNNLGDTDIYIYIICYYNNKYFYNIIT